MGEMDKKYFTWEQSQTGFRCPWERMCNQVWDKLCDLFTKLFHLGITPADQIARLEKALQQGKGNVRRYYRLGQLYLETGRPKLAAECFEWAMCHAEPGENRLYWLAVAYREAEEYEKGLEITRLTLERYPNSLKGLNLQGELQLKVDRPDRAIQCWQRVLAIDANYVRTLNNLGLFRVSQGHLEEARRLFNQATQTEPRNPVPWNNLGLVNSRCGQVEEALQCFETAYQFGFKDAQLLNNIGVCLSQLGRFQEAALYHRLAVESSGGNDSEILENLACVLVKLGDYESALNHYRTLVEQRVPDATWLNNYAHCLEEAGRLTEALENYDQALQLEPDNEIFLQNKGVCLTKLAKYHEALEYFDRVLEGNPQNRSAWSHKGNVYAIQGDDKLAVECYNRSWGLRQ